MPKSWFSIKRVNQYCQSVLDRLGVNPNPASGHTVIEVLLLSDKVAVQIQATPLQIQEN